MRGRHPHPKTSRGRGQSPLLPGTQWRHTLRERRGLCCNGVPMPAREQDTGAILRGLPSVDELLRRPALVELAARSGRAVVLDAARAVLERLRAEISRGAVFTEGGLEAEALEAAIGEEAARDTSF